MLILIIAHVLLTTGTIAGFGYYIRHRTRDSYKREMLRRLALRMREHDNDYPIFYPTQTSTQFQKDKRQTIKTRKEELSEVAKWLELV